MWYTASMVDSSYMYIWSIYLFRLTESYLSETRTTDGGVLGLGLTSQITIIFKKLPS